MKKQTDTARVASPSRVVPLAPYLGGKFRLSKRIIDKIEQIPHTIYAEPFVGLGGIFLRRKQIPKAEVINDINGELVNLYRICTGLSAAIPTLYIRKRSSCSPVAKSLNAC